MCKLVNVAILVLGLSSVAWADDDDDYPAYYVDRVYIPERVVEYAPVQRYYVPPPPPPPRYYYDRRSPQGLFGGMLGSALGYELGAGSPLGAGFGAAAGSWLGNGAYR